MTNQFILAIDQGTSSTRAILFNHDTHVVATEQVELRQYYPHEGWVEHDPEEIWRATLHCCREVIAKAGIESRSVAAIGISNQRETTVLWDRKTGEVVYRAIVWQDRRTTSQCEQLISAGYQTLVQEKTGLRLDPYFSASKIAWILEHVPGAREKALRGELAFGTIDCFLVWRLTGGKRHVTDATNASRTLLFDIQHQCWDDSLLNLFAVPQQILPQVEDSSAEFGYTEKQWFGAAIPITGIAGDQQAAAIGQGCVEPGMIKSTYGTGCFMLLNTGNKLITSTHRLLTTVAYRLNNQTCYALEGSIFIAGAVVHWLRDVMKLIKNSSECEATARQLIDNAGVYLVPAFTGLGAPYWDPNARGAIFGLTLDTGAAHIVRAALEAVCYQTRDLTLAMVQDMGHRIKRLRVDGGMAKNNWLMQFLADMLDVPIDRSTMSESSALGAAYLAGLKVGIYPSLASTGDHWQRDRAFEPSMSNAVRDTLYQGWKEAVAKLVC